jgi:hypothetical protein
VVDSAAEGQAVGARRGQVVQEDVATAVHADQIGVGEPHDVDVPIGERGDHVLHAGGVGRAHGVSSLV